MSIWCSREPIGFSDMFEDEATTNRGEVRSFASGWSNHYPTTDDTAEMPASLELATIPVWCVPGHRDESGFDEIGPWLRLDLHSPTAKTWWVVDGSEPPDTEEVNASVVLDEDAVRLLIADLTEWFATPKVHPTERHDHE